MNILFSSVHQKHLEPRKWMNHFWFPPLIVLLVCLIAGYITMLSNELNAMPGRRRTFIVSIMPFTLALAGITAPILYWVMFRLLHGVQIWYKALLALILIIILAYLTGWAYFRWMLQAPHAPDPVGRFVTQELLGITMPFLLAFGSMAWLKRTIAVTKKEVNDSQTMTPDIEDEPIPASSGNKTYSLTASQIIWAKAEGNYVKLFTEGRFFMKLSTLSRLASSRPQTFVRIHRSYLVNLDWVESIASLDHGDLTVRLRSGDTLKCSRVYAGALRQAMGLVSR